MSYLVNSSTTCSVPAQRLRTDFKISDSVCYPVFLYSEGNTKIFKPFHEGHFTIPYFVNSKPGVQRDTPISLLQHSFIMPNCSSENLGEPHTRA